MRPLLSDASTSRRGRNARTMPVCVHDTPKLSTDYLNRYAEVAMMLSLAIEDPSIMEALADWKPLTYREHFRISGLREACCHIKAYEALPRSMRAEFDVLTKNLNHLAQLSIVAMTGANDPTMRAQLAEISTASLNHHIGRLNAFLNADGTQHLDDQAGDVQRAVDELMALAG